MLSTVSLTMMILLLLLAFTANVHPWTLVSTHTNIVPKLTNDVTLRCFNDGVSQKFPLKLVDRMRILKLDDRTGDWRTFAMKSFSTSVNHTEPETTRGFSFSGNVGKPKESFLSVTWPLALSNTVGSYKCEVLGFDQQDTIQTLSNMTVSITATSVSVNDLLDIIISMKKRARTARESIYKLQEVAKVTKNNQETVRKLETDQETIQEGLEALEMKHNAENSSLTKRFLSFRENVFEDLNKAIENKVEESYYEVRNWPSGPVAIPATEGGCPQSAIDTWVQGYINISGTYSLGPRVSSENHLAKPVLNSNYLSLGFCKKDSTSGIDWPKGSYCTYYGTSSSCPTHFTGIYISISQSSRIYTLSVSKAANPYLSYSSSRIKLYFCCRKDGDARKPILLPTSRPFYLYRYNGVCQSVLNANVTNEWVELASTSYYPVTYSNTNVHPDGNTSRGRVELCYYERHN